MSIYLLVEGSLAEMLRMPCYFNLCDTIMKKINLEVDPFWEPR
jgi:hypothetical protein